MVRSPKTLAVSGPVGRTRVEIAAEAGYDKALVHRYFGSKAALFSAVLDSLEKHEAFESSPERLADTALLPTPDDKALKALLLMLRFLETVGGLLKIASIQG
jgi:AcrR family transcriptional regulator